MRDLPTCQSGNNWLQRASITVDPFLVCKGLPLLGSVPFDNESVPEGEGSARVGSSGVDY